MTQQALPLPEPGKTLAERGPRPKLYAIPVHSLGGYSQSRASKVEYSGWTVTFTPDRKCRPREKNADIQIQESCRPSKPGENIQFIDDADR